MQVKSKQKILNITSAICGVWFLATSWIWTWLLNVFFSFPVGLLGILLWYFGKKYDAKNKWSRVSLILHGLGLASAIISFVLFYIFS